MRIAQVAPPLERVPPTRYGGTERVISTLTEELVKRGHEVTLFASGDSRTAARHIVTVDQALWHTTGLFKDFSPFWPLVAGQVIARAEEFDVIHSHLDFHGFPMARQSPVPVVTTLHGRLDLPELAPLYREYAEVPLVSISDAQRRPVASANWLATVQHGIDLDQFTFNPERGDYLAFLGRISPDKGVDAAIRIARAAGMPLKIAARMPLPHKSNADVRADWEYFENVVQPMLDGSQIELVGQVGGKDKDDFLRNAAALVFPICWPEPFGLVMIEALACGTPVLALNQGSVPEIVRDGVTGFVRETEEELIWAAARLGEIDRGLCHTEAALRFSPARMAESYEALYEELARPASGLRIEPTELPIGSASLLAG